MLEQKQANDFFHLLTWRSPLKRKIIRDIVRTSAKLMISSGDPGMVALGTATEAITDLFERKSRKEASK